MSLPARQRRVLEHIETALRGSDPKLAALYAIFGRLTRGEQMPAFEQLRRGFMVVARLRPRPATAAAGHRARLVPRQRAVLLFPLAIALAVASLVLATTTSARTPCTRVRTVAASSSLGSASLCSSVPSPDFFGH
jgi:hypothetical protein